jgi:hypothetical protein
MMATSKRIISNGFFPIENLHFCSLGRRKRAIGQFNKKKETIPWRIRLRRFKGKPISGKHLRRIL